MLDNKKTSILCILNTLKEYSDENHPLLIQDIIDKINQNYGIELERKSVSNNIDLLEEFGYDIIRLPRKGVYLAERDFDPSEVSYIVDALFSSKTISSKEVRDLASRLASCLSKYQRKRYNYVYKAESISRASNDNIFYNISLLEEAIEQKKKVTLKYKAKYANKNKKIRDQLINPYFLFNNNGQYYLICNYDYYDAILSYNVSYISDLSISSEDVKPVTNLPGYENGLDVSKYAKEHIYAFNGKTIDVTLKLKDEKSKYYVEEWLGSDITFFEENDEIFARAKVDDKSIVYWALQYAESIEVIKPIETREEIKKLIALASEKYNSK
jgi:predicted DNA-binding transcriptional regulator YafY